MVRMNMPIEREKAAENQGKGDGNPSIYKPAPEEAGTSFTNELIIGLMLPGDWKMFNPDQSMIDMYGMTGAGLALPDGSPLATFYLKIPVHGLSNYKRQDGSMGYTYVVCPNAMNEYLMNTFSGPPMFHDSVQCAFCQEQSRWYEVSNARWEELGLGIWDLKGDARTDKVKSDPVLSNASNMARKFRSMDRYAMSVYDYSKQIGARPLDEGQTYVNLQAWFSPKGVFESLRTHHEEGWDFYNLEKPEGVQVVRITKDTTEVTKQTPWKTKYSVTMSPQRIALQPELLTYIQDPANQVDPSKFITISSYEAMVAHIQGQNSSPSASSQNRTYSAPSQPGIPSPPIAPSNAHPVTSVGQAPMPPAPVPAPPVGQAPMPPVGTPPVAPTAPAFVPTTPKIATTPQVGSPPLPPAPVTKPNVQYPPAAATSPTPPVPGQAPITPPIPATTAPATTPNPIPAITPDRTPPQDNGAAAPPIVPKPGLGGNSW